jgi:hypothetical protein
MAEAMTITVFWYVTPCSLVEVTDVTEEYASSIFRVECHSFILKMESGFVVRNVCGLLPHYAASLPGSE